MKRLLAVLAIAALGLNGCVTATVSQESFFFEDPRLLRSVGALPEEAEHIILPSRLRAVRGPSFPGGRTRHHCLFRGQRLPLEATRGHDAAGSSDRSVRGAFRLSGTRRKHGAGNTRMHHHGRSGRRGLGDRKAPRAPRLSWLLLWGLYRRARGSAGTGRACARARRAGEYCGQRPVVDIRCLGPTRRGRRRRPAPSLGPVRQCSGACHISRRDMDCRSRRRSIRAGHTGPCAL